jgi:hypothetical protein
MMKMAARGQGKLAVCLVFPKDRIEGIKANCQFALPSRRDFHSFRASQHDIMSANAQSNFFQIVISAGLTNISAQFCLKV